MTVSADLFYSEIHIRGPSQAGRKRSLE